MRYPSWEGPLLDALAETDLEKLPNKVSLAENALFERSQEIQFATDAQEEKAAIRAALDDLLRIKTDKMGWPRITPKGSGSLKDIYRVSWQRVHFCFGHNARDAGQFDRPDLGKKFSVLGEKDNWHRRELRTNQFSSF